MTNEEAKAIILKEYLCVDRDCDIDRSCGKCDLMMPSKEPILEAYKMAIKALEQEPCEDAIDRKLVCAFIDGLISDDVEREKGLEYIRNMPPVNPQPCEDAISRQAVLDILKREGRKWGNDYRDWVDAIEEIKNLSSVNPTKTGHWVKTLKAVMGEGYMWYCDKCEHQVYQDSSRPYPSEKYCPNCGAKMLEPQERSDKE